MAEEEKKETASSRQTGSNAASNKEQEAKEAEEATEEAAPAQKEAPEKETEEVPAESSVEVPKEFKELIEQIENMSVLQLNELVKTIEARFGVSAAAVAAAPGGGGDAGGSEEKSSFDVELTSVGDQKIAVIKVVKEALGLGLKEAKDMVEGAPATLKQGVAKEEAEELKGKIEEAGGSVELK